MAVSKNTNKRLYNYQEKIVNHIVKNKRSVILNLEMRMGKTVIACEIMNRFPLKTLVVCPASVIKVWQNHIAEWVDKPEDIALVSYAKLSKAKYVNHIKELKVERIIVDEAHRLRNTNSLSNRAIRGQLQRKHWKHKLFITATPIINEPLDMYLMLKNCSKLKFNKCDFLQKFYTFKYCYFSGGMKRDKFTNRKTFMKLYKDNAIRLTFQDLNFNSGFEKCIRILEVDIKEQLVMDNKMNILLRTPKVGLHKAQHGRFMGEIKYMCEDAKKAIIFFAYKETGKCLAKYFNCRMLDGSTPKNKRLAEIEKFKNDPQQRFLCLSINAFSEGIDIRFANTLVIFENTWSGFQDLQAIARCDSIQRTHDLNIIYAMTTDEHKYVISKRKLMYEKLLNWSTDLETL